MSRLNRESIDRFFDYDIHVETRTVFISDVADDGEIGPHLAERVIKSLHLLSAANKDPIRIILNTFGGDWYSGIAIYDAIKSCECHVTIEVYGAAMSMGSIILQAADERIVHENSTIMVHDGSDFFDGHARNMEKWAEYSKSIRQKMYQIYADRTGKSIGFWEKKCTLDMILTAKQAKELGLVDRIAGEADES